MNANLFDMKLTTMPFLQKMLFSIYTESIDMLTPVADKPESLSMLQAMTFLRIVFFLFLLELELSKIMAVVDFPKKLFSMMLSWHEPPLELLSAMPTLPFVILLFLMTLPVQSSVSPDKVIDL